MKAVKMRRQQLGSADTGVTDVGAEKYSVPPSPTETVTGPPSKVGVKISWQVDGCPSAEFVNHGGGAMLHGDRLAVNVSWQVESYTPNKFTSGGEEYHDILVAKITSERGGAVMVTLEPLLKSATVCAPAVSAPQQSRSLLAKDRDIAVFKKHPPVEP